MDAIKSVFLGGNVTKEEFAQEFKTTKGLPEKDIMWGLLQKKLHSAMQKDDWQKMKALYFDMKLFLIAEGRSYFHIAQQVSKCELMSYKAAGFNKVKILTARGEDTCEFCSKLEGVILTVDEALKTMPIPVKDCKNKKYGCRCNYITA